MTRKQHEIAGLIAEKFTCCEKLTALRFIKSVYGTAATLKDILIAYNSLGW